MSNDDGRRDGGDRFVRRHRDALIVLAIALVARFAVVLWAWDTIPPAADGAYYHKIAVRIAEGHGYTWVWPDGAVTYAAHYPVGYPGIVAIGYAIFGSKPVVAMIINALIGSGGAVAARSLVARGGSVPRLALAAGIAVALHPVLVPYTAALMTEGVTASLLIIATAILAHARDLKRDTLATMGWLVLTGIVMGIATLVRPQSIALAPILGGMVFLTRWEGGQLKMVSGAAVVTIVALMCCAPWTIRNCSRMDRCALVSVNGGWNLAIGAQTDSGGWQEITVPEACKTVFQEAAKDDCFGREARKTIDEHPAEWLARAPKKLRVTFDYFGAAPWYLHDANKSRFPYGAKVALGTIETLASRLALAAALVAVFRLRRADKGSGLDVARKVVLGVGLIACVLAPGVIGYLALAMGILLLGYRSLTRELPLIVPITGAVILLTAALHAVFFGAGRYGIVVVPFITALAFVRISMQEKSEAIR